MTYLRLILPVIFCALSGCAHTHYAASEIPRRYAARPVRDYSTLDLTPWASPTAGKEAIRPGDRLQVRLDPGTLEPESELEWNVSVDESGQTTLPNIGPVRLAGLNSAQAEKVIVQASVQRDVFLTPVVEVKVAERPERTVVVTGAVAQPGPVRIENDSVSLADVLVRAGGLTRAAAGTVTVSGGTAAPPPKVASPDAPGEISSVSQQNTIQATTVSLETATGDQLADLRVPEGAVVHVEALPPRPVKVTGVIRDQVIEVPAGENFHLLDAIAMAGGQTYSNWISDRVTITRHVPGENRTVRIKGSIRGARKYSEENVLLAPYDIITVEENLITFTLSTLSGLMGAGVSAAQIGAY